MPSDNLNRDKLPGWNTPPENNAWTKIDNAVNAAAEAASIAPKIITPQKVPGALDVPNNTLERTKVASNTNGSVTVISIGEGGKLPLLKAEARFSLPETQVANVANGTEMEGVTTLATMMATQVAQAADAIIFRDPNRNNWQDQFPSVMVTGTLATKGGLLAAAREAIDIDPAELNEGDFGEQIVVAVAKAYAYLASKKGDPGPYKAVLPANVYADLRAPLLPMSLVTPAERTKFPSLDDIYGTGTLPDLQGLFVSPLYGH